MDDEKKKKAAAAAAVATIIGASSTAIGANFDNPADILQDTNVEPKVQHIDMGDDQDSAVVQDDEDKQKDKETKSTFRGFILELPLAVRVLFVLPGWFIGNGIIYLGSLVFAGLSPILSGILSFAVLALVIAGAFVLTAKAMFPDLPLSKILNRHSIKWILIGSAAVYAANLILGVCWAGYAHFKMIITGGLTLIALGALAIWFARRESRRRKRLEEKKQALQEEEPANNDLVFESLGETFVIKQK